MSGQDKVLQFIVFSSVSRAHDEGVTQSVVRLLSQEGYEAQQLEAEDAFPDAVAAADVIMVEVGDAEDLELCQSLRQHSHKPLLLFGWNLTAALSNEGLALGADSVLPLPAPDEVLRARLNALLRRTGLKRLAPADGSQKHAD